MQLGMLIYHLLVLDWKKYSSGLNNIIWTSSKHTVEKLFHDFKGGRTNADDAVVITENIKKVHKSDSTNLEVAEYS